jgi:hypothetical protein
MREVIIYLQKYILFIMYRMSAGFPPIQYIEKDKETIELKKERLYAPSYKKPLDIKNILLLSVKKKMIDIEKNTINVINTF